MQQLLSPFPGSDLKENSMKETGVKSCARRGPQSEASASSHLAGVLSRRFT